MDHVVMKRSISHPVPETGLVKIIGSLSHAFHPPGNNHVGIAELNGLSRQHHRFQARPAHLVDGYRFHLPRHVGLDGGLFGRVLAIAAGEHQTHDHFIHIFFRYSSPLYRFLNHHRPQFGSPKRAQSTIVVPQRGPHSTDNHSFAHGCLLNYQEVSG
jgi:hypothetical protein